MTTTTGALPVLDNATRYAFFFDVDGTLAAIQPRPGDVFIPESVIADIEHLTALCDGAVALVSGRPLVELDALIAPLHLPAAGVHGAERRDITGEVERVTLPEQVAQALSLELQDAMAAMPDTELEIKGMAFALHYRRAPQFQDAVLALAASVTARYDMLTLQPGKCVVEIKPKGVNKGAALDALMQQPPFAGRTPVFIGDDLTDEAGFDVVNARHGISIKVGEDQTVATYRIPNVDAVHHWLSAALQQLDQDKTLSVRSQGYESFSRRI